MKTGWVLSVTDYDAKDKTYKFVKGDWDYAESKRSDFQKRYEAIQEGRFLVEFDSQYSEFTDDSICKLQLGNDVPSVRNLLAGYDTFRCGNTIELPRKDLESVTKILSEAKCLS
jgi:hypothetical protein